MLSGESNISIDGKGRVVFPVKFREDFKEHIVLTKGLDNCLFVFTVEAWDKIEAEINNLSLATSRGIRRFLIGSKEEIEPDKQGRILIPANLREFARLEKDIVVVGLGTRAEIWSREKWKEQSDAFNENPDEVALKMEELGI